MTTIEGVQQAKGDAFGFAGSAAGHGCAPPGDRIISVDQTASALPPLWTHYSNAQRWFFVAILSLTGMSSAADNGLMPLLVEPIKKEFHASDATMGILTGFAFAIFYALAGVPIARYSDRGDRPLVITLSVLTWSVMTAACGFASSFLQLALLRVGVGAGEAGAGPAGQSLIADYFPPAQRARAYTVGMISGILGGLVAFTAGAKLAVDHGWRMAFLVLAVPGILICLATFFGLHEPRRSNGRSIAAVAQEPFWSTLTALARKRSFVVVNAAALFFMTVLTGVGAWMPAYMGRVLHMDLVTVGVTFGTITSVGVILGIFTGGFVTDFLVRRDVRWMARWPAFGMTLCMPFYLLAFTTSRVDIFLGAMFMGAVILNTVSPAFITLFQSVVGSSRRGTAAALSLFFANMFGGAGAFLIGVLSDIFTAHVGSSGLRWAMISALMFLPPSSWAVWSAARWVKQDLED